MTTLPTDGVTAYKGCGTHGKIILGLYNYRCLGEEPKAGKGKDQVSLERS